jgi:hypothetical protein
MRGFKLVAYFLFLLLGISPALATPSSTAPGPSASTVQSQTQHCGATIADALSESRRALAANDAAADHKALGCLIEAMSAFQTQSLTAVRKDGTRAIAVPATTAPVP